VTLRTRLRAGDVGSVVRMHGVVYAREHGFDPSFEAYVAGPLAAFALRRSARERLWIAERGGRLVGCIAIVAGTSKVAQLRWFLVDPSARGEGLGKRLLRAALAFCRRRGYSSVILWTVRGLVAAAHLYQAAGFRLVSAKRGRRWGVQVVEEKYALGLRARPGASPR
jgi:GNAT superfamily N-acetyltransferase